LTDEADGRSAACVDVRAGLADDGRRLNRRRTRAHLRECASCRAFVESGRRRRRALGALLPVSSPWLLTQVLGAGGGTAAKAAGAATLVGAELNSLPAAPPPSKSSDVAVASARPERREAAATPRASRPR